jgi:hypothetical protein
VTSGDLATQLDSLGLKAQQEVYVRGEIADDGACLSPWNLPGFTPVLAEEVQIRR